MTEAHLPKKGRKVKKRAKPYLQQNNSPNAQQPNTSLIHLPSEAHPSLSNQLEQDHEQEKLTSNKVQKNQYYESSHKAGSFIDQNEESLNLENTQNNIEQGILKEQSELEMRDFKLRFQKSALLFHYNEENAKVPIYQKESILFITLLEKLSQILKDFSHELHESEKEFISGMTLYSTYFSLIGVNQAINLKKMFHQKNAESLHTMRTAHMAKTFHHFLKKNQAHWR